MTRQVRAMQSTDIDSVYAIESTAHRAPWGPDVFRDCVLVGYDCRVLEIIEPSGVEMVAYVVNRYYDNICHVLNLCVAPDHQQKGYGRFLLQQVIDYPAQSAIDSVLLEVRPSNIIALALYQTMGFQQVGIKPDYYKDEAGLEDGFVLQKIRGIT